MALFLFPDFLFQLALVEPLGRQGEARCCLPALPMRAPAGGGKLLPPTCGWDAYQVRSWDIVAWFIVSPSEKSKIGPLTEI